jgi:hypothetical protein
VCQGSGGNNDVDLEIFLIVRPAILDGERARCPARAISDRVGSDDEYDRRRRGFG